ncbi:MAG: HD domain-containing protein [Treponema sp.]|nr:HD domain-containing protein [Treponema sp.]
MKIIINPLLKKFYKIFEEHGFEAYLVGGAVRDILLKKPCSDWDVATNATPEQVMSIFKFVVPTGIAHGTVTVHFCNSEIEVTTFRTESDYSDGRHPDTIYYAATIEEDLSRRDFTMNAIAVNLKNGNIIDPFGGKKDIRKKIIRTVGNPSDRFLEDGLRPVRALRFASKLNFVIEKHTFSEISKLEVINKIKSISLERFRDEFIKMMTSDKPSVGLKLMEKTGILEIFIPELTYCRGCIQGDERGYHDFDVLDHLFYACDGAPSSKIKVRLAALFHDIAKPLTKKIVNTTDKKTVSEKSDSIANKDEIYTFYNHDIVSSEVTQNILRRLKFSNEEIFHISHLIKNHMFHYEPSWSDAAVRRFIVRVGLDYINDLFDLRVADVYGMHNNPVNLRKSYTSENLLELQDRINKITEKQNALSLKDLAINGKDLISLGFEPGKKLGTILNELFEVVLEDPEMNCREKLLNIAQTFR